LNNAKQKILSSSTAVRVEPADERSSVHQAPMLELEGDRANIEDNLFKLGQGRRFYSGILGGWVIQIEGNF